VNFGTKPSLAKIKKMTTFAHEKLKIEHFLIMGINLSNIKRITK